MKHSKTRLIFSIIIFLCICTFFISDSNAQEPADIVPPRYAPDSIVVKYKQTESPIAFQEAVEKRKEQSETLLGRIFLFQQDVSLTLRGEETPEEKLVQYELLAQGAGVVEADQISTKDPNLFVYTTDGTKPVESIIKLYESREEVMFAEPNYYYAFLNTPTDTDFDQQWALKKINAETAWDQQTGSKNIIVANIDSGVDETHPDLTGNLVEVKSFTTCAPGGDQLGHGTHTTGIIGAMGNNATGVTGLNWNVGLLILKVGCGPSDILLSSIIAALDYAATKNVKVVNMSFGGPSCSQALSDSIAHIVQQGTVVVAAAGNSGQENADQLCPASDPNVITVSATGPNDELAVYSSFGSSVDVSAPGGNGNPISGCDSTLCILSTLPQGRYGAIHGTSMAAPHVTGLAALMFAIKPDLTPQDIKQILESTAVDLGEAGRDNQFGSGRINAVAALNAVSGNSNPQPTQVPVPTENIQITQIPNPTEETHVEVVDPTQVPDCQAGGDVDCDGAVNQADLDKWKSIFQSGKGMLDLYNRWRTAFFNLASAL